MERLQLKKHISPLLDKKTTIVNEWIRLLPFRCTRTHLCGHHAEWETAVVPEPCLQANSLWHGVLPQSAAALTVAAGGWKWGLHLIAGVEGFVQAACRLTQATGSRACWCIHPLEVYYRCWILLACLLASGIAQKFMNGFQSNFLQGLHVAGREGISESNGDSQHHVKANLHSKTILFFLTNSQRWG